MEKHFIHRFACLNGTWLSLEHEFQYPLVDQSVYEVIKIVGGIPLFIEDHLERLAHSMELTQINGTAPGSEAMIALIQTLCNKSQVFFGNAELMFFNSPEGDYQFLLGFIAHSYPAATDYLHGIGVGLFLSERNQPNAKVKNTETRIKANQYLKEHNYYEVLLYNQLNQITEGSRSNVFFIKSGQVYTAPDELVLKGISRKYVIQVIQEQELELVEKALTLEDLPDIEAAFLCGTSPGVIPIRSIEQHSLDYKNLLVKSIMLGFNFKVQRYLSESSNTFHPHR